MLPIKSRESIDWVMRSVEEIETAIAMLNMKLKDLSRTLDEEVQSKHQTKVKLLNTKETARLLQLNRNLATLQNFLADQANQIKPALLGKKSDPHDPMADFEIETKLTYALREDDEDSCDDSDNCLTIRNENLKIFNNWQKRDDFREYRQGNEDLNAEPHCWLFHDLYDYSYGLAQPKVPLRDCLRLGEVWVDMIITHQYRFNLDTGEWS